MGRVPFYAYPNSPYSFYAPPAEAYFQRRHPPFSPASSSSRRPSPTSRSVVDVPVYDSAPSRFSSSPAPQRPPAAGSLVDPSSAATRIQSHFRGFCVRRHHPLLHLRTIARARKQLEDLQSELEIPEFSLKVRASEKERLRFSESVMALILRLDAIEGSMAEVRSQRKEATKMAIKLQDALDAIMMQKDEIAALDPKADEGGIVPLDAIVSATQHQEALHPEVDMVQEEACAVSAGVNALQEQIFSEDNVSGTCMPNIDDNNGMDMGASEDVSPLHPCEAEDLAEKREAGSSGSQVQHAKAMCEAEQDMSLFTGETSGSNASHAVPVASHTAEEVGDGSDALQMETHGNYPQNHILDINVDQDTCVDDMVGAGDGSIERESNHGTHRCMDVVQEGISQAAELCTGIPTVEEKCDYPHYGDAAHGNECRGPLTSLERLTDGNCSLDGHNFPELHQHGYEECSNEAKEANSIDKGTSKAQTCTLSMVETPSALQDNPILHQLSEDCRQLKSLVGKLLVQNKAQSNILCVLAKRLELLEHQQQQNCRRNRLKMDEKGRLKKGSKRSVKHHNYEECY